jgi:hypothetical protein
MARIEHGTRSTPYHSNYRNTCNGTRFVLFLLCSFFSVTRKGLIMSRSEYLSHIIRLLTVDEIKRSAKNPTASMSKTHIALHYVALRRLGAL